MQSVVNRAPESSWLYHLGQSFFLFLSWGFWEWLDPLRKNGCFGLVVYDLPNAGLLTAAFPPLLSSPLPAMLSTPAFP